MPVDRDCRVVARRTYRSGLRFSSRCHRGGRSICPPVISSKNARAFRPHSRSLSSPPISSWNHTLLLKRRPLSGTFTDVPKSSSLAGLGKSLRVAMLQKYTACLYDGLNASRREFIHARYVNALILLKHLLIVIKLSNQLFTNYLLRASAYLFYYLMFICCVMMNEQLDNPCQSHCAYGQSQNLLSESLHSNMEQL